MRSHTHLSLDQRVKRLDRRIAEIELWEKRQNIPLDHAPLAMGRPWPSREGVARFEHPPVEALSRIPPRRADCPGADQVPASLSRTRSDRGGGPVVQGDHAGRSDRRLARGPVARAAAQSAPRHPPRIEHPARSLRPWSASSPRSSRRRRRSSERSSTRSATRDFRVRAGVIRRPTHRNTFLDRTRFEVAAHPFVDLSEHGYGISLLNDGKYGRHALHNALGLSLLRSPVYPDPLADEGRQRFTYALYPRAGDWLRGGVLAEAEDLNQPLIARTTDAGAESMWTAAAVSGLDLGLCGVKAAEDGRGLVLRTYEPAGARGTAAVSLAEGWRLAGEVDLLEDPVGEANRSLTPFQIHSWRLEGRAS